MSRPDPGMLGKDLRSLLRLFKDLAGPALLDDFVHLWPEIGTQFTHPLLRPEADVAGILVITLSRRFRRVELGKTGLFRLMNGKGR